MNITNIGIIQNTMTDDDNDTIINPINIINSTIRVDKFKNLNNT